VRPVRVNKKGGGTHYAGVRPNSRVQTTLRSDAHTMAGTRTNCLSRNLRLSVQKRTRKLTRPSGQTVEGPESASIGACGPADGKGVGCVGWPSRHFGCPYTRVSKDTFGEPYVPVSQAVSTTSSPLRLTPASIKGGLQMGISQMDGGGGLLRMEVW
jgi:hypothetical protein